MTHEELIEFYFAPARLAISRAAYRFECDMIDRYNAAGVMPPIEKLTFEEFQRLGESSDSGQKILDAQPMKHHVETPHA